jgi:hypothetical protein
MSVSVRCKITEISSEGGDSGGMKCKRSCVDAYGTVWRSLMWREFRVSRFCVTAFGNNLALVTVNLK